MFGILNFLKSIKEETLQYLSSLLLGADCAEDDCYVLSYSFTCHAYVVQQYVSNILLCKSLVTQMSLCTPLNLKKVKMMIIFAGGWFFNF